MKILRTEINNCRDCPHYDHTGAWTPGGAMSICRKTKSSQNKYGKRELPVTAVIGRHGNPTRAYTGKIPDWCPLP